MTVTVALSPSSIAFVPLRSDTVNCTTFDVSSLSVMVSVCADGCVIARLLAANPVTSTVRSGWSISLSRAAIVTVPVLVVPPAAMVSVVPLRVKSPITAGFTGAAETATVVAWLDGWSRVAVTVLDPPSSEIEVGASTSVTTGVASLSASVTVRPPAGATVSPDAVVVPLTRTVSSGSSVSSSTGARSKVAAALIVSAGIVTVRSGTSEKSVPATAVTPATVTVTAVASGRAASFSVAVTVTVRAGPVASSATVSGETDSVTVVDAVSSSAIVSVCAWGCTISRSLAAVPETVALLFPV